MKKQILRLFLMGLVSLSAFVACKKDKNESLAVTVDNLVGNYKLADIRVKSAELPEFSVLSEFDNCEKDNILQLQAGGVLKVVDEGEKCDMDEETTWGLNGSKITLDIFMIGYPGDYEVVSLTQKQLVVRIAVENTETIYTVYFNRV